MAEIHSARLRLRPVCLADAEAISAFTSDIKVARMTTRIPHPNSVEAVQASLASLEGGPEHVFAANGGSDIITDFKLAEHDILRLDHTLWAGKILTVAQVISTYAHVVRGEVVFDFGTGAQVHLEGLTVLTPLVSDIQIF